MGEVVLLTRGAASIVEVVVELSVAAVVRMIDVVCFVLAVVVLANGATRVVLAKGATSTAVEAVAKSPAAKRATEVKEGIMIKNYDSFALRARGHFEPWKA